MAEAAQRKGVNRPFVGVLAIACLVGGGATLIFDSFNNPWAGALIRVGVLLVVFWIALPAGSRPAAWANFTPWTLVGIVAGALVLARFIRQPLYFIPVVLGAIATSFVLRPRRRRPAATKDDLFNDRSHATRR